MTLLTAEKAKLGFIGMGAMGSRLARRLSEHGYQLVVYDRTRRKAEAMAAYGASVAASLPELAANSDVVLSCLTNDDAVRSVYLGPEGVLGLLKRGTVLLEMSTLSPRASRELHEEASSRGIQMLDVAISGSTLAVEAGTVTLLVGGDAELFEAAQPIFKTIASQYFLMGPAGAGSSMKLAVNTILGVSMQAIAEAVALGEAAGLDRNRLLEVLAQTAVIAPAHRGKLATAAQNHYGAQFGVGLMNKDFRLILEQARESKLSMPATRAAFEVSSAALGEEPDADFSIVIRHAEKMARGQ